MCMREGAGGTCGTTTNDCIDQSPSILLGSSDLVESSADIVDAVEKFC
jgi:hypothetical protein